MAPIVPIAPGVFRIPTFSDAINTLVVVDDDGSVALVDTGLKRASGRIVAGLAAIGKHPQDVQRIILTHAHNDHAGSAADMVARTGLAGVGLHRDEIRLSGLGVPPNQGYLSPLTDLSLSVVDDHSYRQLVENLISSVGEGTLRGHLTNANLADDPMMYVEHQAPEVRAWAAERIADPTALMQLAMDRSEMVRAAVLANDAVTAEARVAAALRTS
jgi:hypothetical protein